MLQADSQLVQRYPLFDDYKVFIERMIIHSEAVPVEISNEYPKMIDLLEVCYFKSSLFEMAQLQAIMLFEKAVRMRLYDEYKTITKIKFSVLLDKIQQLSLLDKNVVLHFRTLKDLRNKTVHHGSETVEIDLALENIRLLMISLVEIYKESKA